MRPLAAISSSGVTQHTDSPMSAERKMLSPRNGIHFFIPLKHFTLDQHNVANKAVIVCKLCATKRQ